MIIKKIINFNIFFAFVLNFLFNFIKFFKLLNF